MLLFILTTLTAFFMGTLLHDNALPYNWSIGKVLEGLAFACSLSLLTYLDRVCIMRAGSDIQADLARGLGSL